MKNLNKAQVELMNELEVVVARMEQIDSMDVFSDEIAAEYEALAGKEKELNQAIHESGKSKAKICKNTQELVSLNID